MTDRKHAIVDDEIVEKLRDEDDEEDEEDQDDE